MQNKFTTFIFEKFKDVFSIDLRALAFFRIFIGGFTILYLAIKLGNVQAFFSDSGILPRSQYANLTSEFIWSIHFISGDSWVQVLLILTHMLFAVLMILGYRTRLMTFLVWLLLISLQNRNLFVLNFGDQLFRSLLFWSIFLPLGLVWSLDSIWADKKIISKKWFSVATVAILLQVVLFYVVNWFLKDSLQWKGIFSETKSFLDLFNFSKGFTATFYALGLTYLVTPIGSFLLRFPGLLKVATIIYIFFELIGPLLLLSPIKTKQLRYFSIAVFFTFVHGMLFLMLYTGLFQFFCIAGLCLFLPSEFWNNLEKKLFTGKHPLKIYYDQECELCKTGVCALKGSTGSEKIVPIQSNLELLNLGEEITTIIVEDENGKRYQKIDAFIKMFENSNFTSWIAGLLKIKPFYWIATKKYEFIAKNRHSISSFISWIKPKNNTNYSIWIRPARAFVCLCMLIVLSWNIGKINKIEVFTDPLLRNSIYAIGLNQHWGMFAPYTYEVVPWVIVPGELNDGTKVDVLNEKNGDVNFERSAPVPARFSGQSWRNYLFNYPGLSKKTEFGKQIDTKHTKLFSRYLCTDWNTKNKDNQKQLKSLTVYILEERNVLPGEPKTGVTQKGYMEFVC